MFCPYCGAENDEGNEFCPYCGTYLNVYVIHTFPVPKKSRKNAYKALAVVCILLSAGFLGVLLWAAPSGQPFEPDEYVIYGSGSIGSGVIRVSGYEDGDPNDGSCPVTFTCSANTFTGYTWGIRSLDESLHYKEGNLIYTRPYEVPADATFGDGGRSMTCTLAPGHYSVKVGTNLQEYTGTVAFQGEVTKSYSWKYTKYMVPTPFSFDFVFNYGECLDGVGYGGDRAIRSVYSIGNMIKDYTAQSDLIVRMESQLRGLYTEKYGPPGTNDSSYAQFLLTFVQMCFEYPPTYTEGGIDRTADDFVYGQSEYWAFPTELIMQGQGDCEDTSFLCAVLFRAAGFRTAVAMLPGHAMAGVAVPGIVSSSGFENSYVVKQKVGGITYYGCETTSRVQYPIGYTAVTYKDSLGAEKPLSDAIRDSIPYAPTYGDGFYPLASG